MRFATVTLIATALAAAGCNREQQVQQEAQQKPAPAAAQTPAPGRVAGVTPMNQRVAVLGLLNKRNGIVRDIPMRPGQAVRAKDVIVRLRACEASAPWEQEKLTGAFIQVDVQLPDERWHRVFSGWTYKESPSLNVVEHPVYDVWVKSCAMTFPAGAAPPPAPAESSSPSSARNSGGASGRERARTPGPTASDSNPV